MLVKPENIGSKMWVGGTFKLYKTDRIQKFLPYGELSSAEALKKFTRNPEVDLEREEVTIISVDKFMTKDGDIYYI